LDGAGEVLVVAGLKGAGMTDSVKREFTGEEMSE
jgi:hypothetical protein